MKSTKKFPLASHRKLAPHQSTRPMPQSLKPAEQTKDSVGEAMRLAAASLPTLLLPSEVAGKLGVSLATLERWRINGEGPLFIKLSRSTVRYALEDVCTFVAARMKTNTIQ